MPNTFAIVNQKRKPMQTTSNNFSVESLVEKYREQVKKKSTSILGYERAAELQLLAHLYNAAAGVAADDRVNAVMGEFAHSFDGTILETAELQYLTEHFGEASEYLFSLYNEWQYAYRDISVQPKEIIELLKATLETADGSEIYLPYAGVCDVVMAFPKCRFTGFIDNEHIWALAMIRLYAAGIEADIACGDGTDKAGTQRKYDAAVYLRPLILPDEEVALVGRMYDSLADGGRLWMLCTAGELCSEGDEWAALRSRMVADKAAAAVIQLPYGVSNNHYERPFVLYATREKHDGVAMIDASFATKELGYSPSYRKFDTERFVNVMKNAGLPELEDEPLYHTVAFDRLDARVLLPQYYIIARPGNAVPLSTVATVLRPSRSELLSVNELPEGARIVNRSLLTDRFADMAIQPVMPDSIETTPKKREDTLYRRYSKVELPAVFFTTTNAGLRIGYIESHDGEVYADIALNTLSPTKGTDCTHLASQLLWPDTAAIIAALAEASPIGIIRKWMAALIPVLNETDEQRARRVEQLALDSLSESERKRKVEYERHIMSIRLRKHAITQKLSACSAVFNTLNGYRKNHGGCLNDGDVISRITGMTAGTAFNEIESRLKTVAQMVAQMASVGNDYGKAEYIEPQGFLDRYIDRNSNGWTNCRLTRSWGKENTNLVSKDQPNPFDDGYELRKGDPLFCLSFSPLALERVLDNIVQNAVCHGFTDNSRDDYEINFAWRKEDTDIIIEVSNNGNPLPDDMDSALIMEYGYSSKLNLDGHSGLGGYEIAETMQLYGGEAKVISTPGERHTVTYRLRFKSNV